jgi:hypothetical protein
MAVMMELDDIRIVFNCGVKCRQIYSRKGSQHIRRELEPKRRLFDLFEPEDEACTARSGDKRLGLIFLDLAE